MDNNKRPDEERSNEHISRQGKTEAGCPENVKYEAYEERDINKNPTMPEEGVTGSRDTGNDTEGNP